MRNILLLTAVAGVLTGCFQSRKNVPGAEETVKTFYESLYRGEFDKAEQLCDTLKMDGYISSFKDAWENADSTVCAIASDILSEMTLTVTDTQKDGQSRTIFYELSNTDYSNKEKVATLRKEEGAWKIEEITDRN